MEDIAEQPISQSYKDEYKKALRIWARLAVVIADKQKWHQPNQNGQPVPAREWPALKCRNAEQNHANVSQQKNQEANLVAGANQPQNKEFNWNDSRDSDNEAQLAQPIDVRRKPRVDPCQSYRQ